MNDKKIHFPMMLVVKELNMITPLGFVKYHQVALVKLKKKKFPALGSFSCLLQDVAPHGNCISTGKCQFPQPTINSFSPLFQCVVPHGNYVPAGECQFPQSADNSFSPLFQCLVQHGNYVPAGEHQFPHPLSTLSPTCSNGNYIPAGECQFPLSTDNSFSSLLQDVALHGNYITALFPQSPDDFSFPWSTVD